MAGPEPVNGTGASISYEPVDRLSRIGGALIKAMPEGNDDVRVTIMLDDDEMGTVAYRGYDPDDEYDRVELLTDVAIHLVYLGRVMGVEIEISSNGVKMLAPPRTVGGTPVNLNEIITELEQHITELAAKGKQLLAAGENKAADICTESAAKLTSIAAKLRAAAGDS